MLTPLPFFPPPPKCFLFPPRAGVLSKIKTLQDDGISMNNPTVALLSATVLFHEQVRSIFCCIFIVVFVKGGWKKGGCGGHS